MNRFVNIFIWSFLSLIVRIGYAQQSSNVVDYQVTYDLATDRYTAYVVPRYSTAANVSERGGTAQFTIKVPAAFLITDITDIRGTWEKSPLRLGPGNAGQDWSGSGLDPAINYYVIGKSPSETNYGPFVSGTPVALFTFRGNGCFGPISPLEPGNLFISQADQRYSLNVANSFYSVSGQPSGGNQNPLEQFRTVAGPAAQCTVLQANPDSQSLTAGTTATIPVLTNDTRNGQPVSATSVTVTVSTPVSGTATVNADKSISYSPAPGYSGPISFTYTICDVVQPTVCSSSSISLTVNSTLQANPDSQMLSVGMTATIPVLANDIRNGQPVSATSVTVTVSTPVSGTATVNADNSVSYNPAPGYSGPISFTYTVCDAAQPAVCSSAPISLTVNPGPPPQADLLITKQVSQSLAAVNSTVSFTVTVQNTGPGNAINVSVSDTIARTSSVVVQGVPTPSKGNYNTTTGIWTVGNLTAGEVVSLVITVSIQSQGVLLNVASVTATGSVDPNSANNEASACATIPTKLCPGEAYIVTVPSKYENVSWYKDGSLYATGNSITISQVGVYTVTSTSGNCPLTGCCPIIVEQGDCCIPNKCVPFVIRKTRTRA